ncbi:hypothetical protein FOA43_000237 [Brettanomyces nanus]|uniref:Uncharacterized protein n=1 Tax=Eeniella nana TaxID=13502 RepID=A0A875RWS2_EENNA|nr:uncharacterized protein FOA43_000237 [Brettanomyces nanus]QPG72933.1 hypothetical protein FOA43_000237 [Brettanomyces nanus]
MSSRIQEMSFEKSTDLSLAPSKTSARGGSFNGGMIDEKGTQFEVDNVSERDKESNEGDQDNTKAGESLVEQFLSFNISEDPILELRGSDGTRDVTSDGVMGTTNTFAGSIGTSTGSPAALRDKFIVRKRTQFLRSLPENRKAEEEANSSVISDIINRSMHLPQLDLSSLDQNFRSGSNATETVQLRKELMNCRIQLRLQSDLLKEKYIEKVGQEELSASAHLSAVNDALRGELEDLEGSFHGVKVQLEKMHLDYEEWQAALGKVMTKLRESNDKKVQKVLLNCKEESDMKNKLDIVDSGVGLLIEDRKNEGISMNNKLKSVLDELKSEREQFEVLSRNLEDYKSSSKMASESDEVGKLRDELGTKEDAYRQVKEELKASEERVGRLLDEQRETAGEIDGLQEQLNNFKKMKTELESEINDLKVQNDDLANQTSDAEGNSRVDAILATDINFQTHAIKILSRLLDKKSIREAAEKVLQLANRDQLELKNGPVRQLLAAVYDYLLAGIQTVVMSRLEMTREANDQIERDRKIIDNVQKELKEKPGKLLEDATSSTSKLRIDELTKRWKTAEEALSFERKQSKKRLDELEQENSRLKAKVDLTSLQT